MHATLSLIRREFNAYFLSPIAYVVLAVFLAVTGHLFYLTLEQLTATGPDGTYYPLQLMYGSNWFWLVFLIIPPLLTMRLFAEERAAGTLEMLLTAPLRDWQIVLSKYVACFGFYLVLWLPTLVYLPVLLDMQVEFNPVWTPFSLLLLGGAAAAVLGAVLGLATSVPPVRALALFLFAVGAACAAVGAWGHYTQEEEQLLWVYYGIDPMPALSSYVGLILAGAMFLALGLFVSSLVRSQMVAALLAIFLSLGFIALGFLRPDMDVGGLAYQVLFFFTVPLHFERNFSRGLVDTRQLVLYGSVTLFCLFLTVRSLETRRWR
jgi:ABC-2 type transport system permease protein